MSVTNNTEDELLNKCKKIIEENFADERFGVSQLAREMGMSRSYLHRKINAVSKTSVSQFIRQIRLKHALDMLRQTSVTVSEVAYNTGFSSVTYFNKCFHDYYGYSPGKVGKRDEEEELLSANQWEKFTRKKVLIPVISVMILIIISIFVINGITRKHSKNEISIAVLNWTDNSTDSLYIHVISGINDYVRNGLEKVNNLTVRPRRAVVIYENNFKSPKEIAKELDVDLILDGRGYTNNNKIDLNVELIDAVSGKQLWSEPFNIDRNDVIAFQPKLTKKIINEGLKITLTKEEKRKIEKFVTYNKEANNHYSIGLRQLNLAQCNYMCNHQPPELVKYLEDARDHFEIAVHIDSTLSQAYAHLAKIYYYMGMVHDTVYSEQIHKNAERAIHFDMNSEEAQLAIAYYCMVENKSTAALDHLDLAVNINSNSAEAIGRLVFVFGFDLRIADKFVEYAIKNVKINSGITEDLETRIIINYCTAIALSRLGFFKKAEPFYDETFKIAPNHVPAFIQKTFDMIYVNNEKIDKVLDYFIDNFPHNGYYKLDEDSYYRSVGYLYYLMEDYESAYKYFNIQLKKYGEIGPVVHVLSYFHVLKKLGKNDELADYKMICQQNIESFKNNRFKDFRLCEWNCLTGNKENALKYLEQVAQLEYGIPSYEIIYDLYHSPVFENLKNDKKFEELRDIIETDFMAKHNRMKEFLKDNKSVIM